MKSKAGAILVLIGAIFSLILIILSFFIIYYIISNSPAGQLNPGAINFLYVQFSFLILPLFIMLGLKIWAIKLLNSQEGVFKGGLIALITGILSADIFSIIGGILGIVASKK